MFNHEQEYNSEIEQRGFRRFPVGGMVGKRSQ
jgi:hypothetical protein